MISKIKVGSYTGNATARVLALGFIPSVFIAINSTDYNQFGIWDETFTDAYGLNMDNAPDKVTSNCITPYDGIAVPTALTGTVTVTAGDATITGSATTFTTELEVGDIVEIEGQSRKILDITSTTVCTASQVFDTAKAAKACTRMTGRSVGLTIGTDNAFNKDACVFTYIAIRK